MGENRCQVRHLGLTGIGEEVGLEKRWDWRHGRAPFCELKGTWQLLSVAGLTSQRLKH